MRRPIDRLFQWVVILMGFALGAQPIGDNSMFVHLRTGIDIVHGGGIPRRDPYSFTAAGTRWVVQSWLPSTIYGATRAVGGDGLLLVLQGLLTATLAYFVFRLAGRAGSTLRATGAAMAALAVGGPFWSGRPLLFGFVCFGLMIIVTAERRPPWLLVPIAWVWVSSHGSFPLGGVWLTLVAVGAAVEHRRLWTEEAKRFAWFVGGLLVACVNPLGPRLLLFPLVLGEHRAIFRVITEWRSPDFQQPLALISLVGIVTSVGILARGRLSWSSLLPAACFLGLGLLALRNLAPLSLVMAHALGLSLARDGDEHIGHPVATARWSRPDRLAGALVAAAGVLVLVHALASPALDLSTYPRRVVAEGEKTGVLGKGRRVAAQDTTGCYLILHRGRGASVFIDDRYDMYPVPVAEAYKTLLHAEPGSLTALDAYRVDTVLWDRREPLVALLVTAGWTEALGDKRWVVLTRPGTWPTT